MTSHLRLALLLLCAFFFSTVARAQQPLSPQAVEAKRRFDRGVQLIGEARWSEAIVELEAARAIYPTAPIHFNLGLAYRAVGRAREAIASFERFRRAVGDSGEAARQAEVTRYLATLRASLAQLNLDVLPAEAAITVDKEAARAGVIELDAGSHTLTASAEGYATQTREVALPPGSTVRLQLRLQPIRRNPHLSVASEVPGGVIRIDGMVRGQGSVEAELSIGRHVIEVEAPGYQTARQEIDLESGARRDLSVQLKKKRRVGPYVAIGIVAAVVVGSAVAVGVVLGSRDQAPIVPPLGVIYTGLEVAAW